MSSRRCSPRAGGFDVAIANPPYVQLQSNEGLLANHYKDAGYRTFARTGDIYQLFYERGCQALKPDQWPAGLHHLEQLAEGRVRQSPLAGTSPKGTHPWRLLELGKDVFESAIVDSGVLVLRTGGAGEVFPGVDMDRLAIKEVPPQESLWGRVRPGGDAPWSILSPLEQSVMDKMLADGDAVGRVGTSGSTTASRQATTRRSSSTSKTKRRTGGRRSALRRDHQAHPARAGTSGASARSGHDRWLLVCSLALSITRGLFDSGDVARMRINAVSSALSSSVKIIYLATN